MQETKNTPMKEVASLVAGRTIRKKILQGDYKPGESLTALTLAEELGISRTPVREALRDLEREGLVVITPRLGAYVRELTVDEITDLFVLRYALEPSICMLAASRRLSADLRALKDIMSELGNAMQTIVDAPKSNAAVFRYQELDAEFHIAIATAAHSEVAQELSRKLQVLQLLSRKWLPKSLVLPEGFVNQVSETQAQHEAILCMIEDRQASAAKGLMEQHLRVLNDAASTWIGIRGDGNEPASSLKTSSIK